MVLLVQGTGGRSKVVLQRPNKKTDTSTLEKAEARSLFNRGPTHEPERKAPPFDIRFIS